MMGHRMTSQLDRYRIHALIARGGMADILLASPLDAVSVAELVAVKRIRPEFSGDPAFVQMFLDEARITRELNHPNIACLIDWGEALGTPYLVMEFVRGVDVALILKRRALPPHLAAEVAVGVASALHHAHEQCNAAGEPLGIVHRDVTPHNVMVTFDGQVKLLDFGIALARVRAERTRTGILKGKWAYMSPEQIAGRKVDRRSDVFSLGSLMYEMLAGKRAFAGESPTDILTAVALREPPPLREVLPGAPAALNDILLRCLRKEPQARYQTALEVATRLEDARRAAGEPPGGPSLAEFAVGLFPKRASQIKSVLSDIASTFKVRDSFEPSGSTQIEAVPFARVAADLEPSGAEQPGEAEDLSPTPSAPVATPPPAQPRPVDRREPPAEIATGIDDGEGEGSTWPLVVAVLLGLALGLGLVIAVWLLAGSS
jgi:serine/threonine-protein kinase